ncbi:MAG TPA: hypothetical protein VFZ09_21725 [Archangium sp.]|uniref:hypothetical protein n=1 Tax=Archangium sp. TaxID=1872627 RepID=UPI002E353A34|nr:hypothetical protein [Archangium sp.]HEX5748875.1 hypothetical protein [Archangium sp.]
MKLSQVFGSTLVVSALISTQALAARELTPMPSVSEYFSQEDDAAPRGNWSAPDTVVPVLVDGIVYSPDAFRTLNGAGVRHFVLDENAAQQGVMLGFRTKQALADYFRSQGRMPSDDSAMLCNNYSYWYEDWKYLGRYISAQAGYGYNNLDTISWGNRISSVIPTTCGRYAILWEAPNYAGASLFLGAGYPAEYLATYGWNDRARSVGSWQ